MLNNNIMNYLGCWDGDDIDECMDLVKINRTDLSEDFMNYKDLFYSSNYEDR